MIFGIVWTKHGIHGYKWNTSIQPNTMGKHSQLIETKNNPHPHTHFERFKVWNSNVKQKKLKKIVLFENLNEKCKPQQQWIILK